MEDMGNDPSRESATCGHPVIGQPDKTQKAVKGDQYASRHDPFVYFHSIIDLPTCDAHVVNLSALAGDLQDEATTPNYVFITPNLCHDGHDGGGSGRTCVDGQPGGLISADKFLADTVPSILASPAYRHDGLLIVTFDEADSKGGDASACCRAPRGPNIGPGAMVVFDNPPPDPPDKIPDKGPGITGPAGGRVGAVLVSRFIKPGTISKAAYNHYALLRSIEDFFDLEHLGYAGQEGLKSSERTYLPGPMGKRASDVVSHSSTRVPALSRDRSKLRVWNGPGSAEHRSARASRCTASGTQASETVHQGGIFQHPAKAPQ